MPCSRSSRHSTSARATTPYLATQYGPSPRLGTSPANDAVNRTWPPCPGRRGAAGTPRRRGSVPTGRRRSPSASRRGSSPAIGPPTATPALLNTTCTAPRASNAASASAVTCSSDRTSHTTPWASIPSARNSSTARSSAGASTSASTRRAPRAPSWRAVANPIPLAPPVMTAPLPVSVSTCAPFVERMSRRPPVGIRCRSVTILARRQVTDGSGGRTPCRLGRRTA